MEVRALQAGADVVHRELADTTQAAWLASVSSLLRWFCRTFWRAFWRALFSPVTM
jgi:hypothetical protein